MKYSIIQLLFIAIFLSTSAKSQVETPNYGIVAYHSDSPISVIYMTRRDNLFGTKYTQYRTICTRGIMTLFLGTGKTAEEAAGDKRGGGLLINGSGDDAPRIACELAGLIPGSNNVVKSNERSGSR